MQNPSNTSDFITPLINSWLIQYKKNDFSKLTKLGLFNWEYKLNRRNPDKPRRVPKIERFIDLNDLPFKQEIYFLEINTNTIHVYQCSGFSLAGQNIAQEFLYHESKFVAGKVLLKMIR
jgi:hypothetical protein